MGSTTGRSSAAWEDELRSLRAGEGELSSKRVRAFAFLEPNSGSTTVGPVDLLFDRLFREQRPVEWATVGVYDQTAEPGAIPEALVPIQVDDFGRFVAGDVVAVRGTLRPGSAAAFDLASGTVYCAGPTSPPGVFRRRWRL